MKESIDHFLRAGFELKASDIHLTVGVPPVMRINGDLKKYGKNILKPRYRRNGKAIIPDNMWERFKEKGELGFFLWNYQEFHDFGLMLIFSGHVWRLRSGLFPQEFQPLEELDMPDILKIIAKNLKVSCL